MNEREKQIFRLALSYLTANLDDVCQAFAVDPDFPSDGKVDCQGEVFDNPTESEIEQLWKTLQ